MSKKHKKSRLDKQNFNEWVSNNLTQLEADLANPKAPVKTATRFADDELSDKEWLELHKGEFEDDDLRYADYWDRTGGKTTTSGVWNSYARKECHRGNKSIVSFENKGTLYAGGTSRGAKVYRGMLVVDLTGGDLVFGAMPTTNRPDLFPSISEQNVQFVSLPILDYGQPEHLDWTFWKQFAADIKAVLLSGKDVLVCCMGGHGRTGVVLSILMGLWMPELSDPVKWVRANYCDEAVETRNQERYVAAMIGEQKFVVRTSPAVTYLNKGNGNAVLPAATAELTPYWNSVTKKLEYR